MFEPKISTADATATPDWQRYLVAQDWHRFTPADHRTWDRLTERQVKLLEGRIVSPFLSGWKRLGLYEPGIPKLDRLSDRLEAATGWRVARIPGLLHESDFFSLISERVFPSTDYIRGTDELDYTPAPDCFHDIFGHMPMLTEPAFADYYQLFGQAAMNATGMQRIQLERMHWFTVEFGLVNTDEGIRAYGSGIMSSPGELTYAVESDVPERKPFDPVDVLRTPYRIDIFQPIYFVIDGFDTLFDLAQSDLIAHINEARKLGMHQPKFEAA